MAVRRTALLLALASPLGARPLLNDHAALTTGQFSDQRSRNALGKVWLVSSSTGVLSRKPSLRAAVTAAESGDTVLLSKGVFSGPDNRNIVVDDKDIVIRGILAPTDTIIDCQLQGNAFCFTGFGVTPASRLSSLTVINGSTNKPGGAVQCVLGAAPAIEDCHFLDNATTSDGGALYYFAGPSSPGVVRNSLFLGNYCDGQGGSMHTSFVDIDSCVIAYNIARGSSGGAACRNATRIANCLIHSNTSLFSDGGGLFATAQELVNLTIAHNASLSGAGGLVLGIDPQTVVRNTVLWGNTSTTGSQVNYVSFSNVHPVFEYCLIENGESGVEIIYQPGAPGGGPTFLGLQTSDPLFCDPSGGDFRLSAGSPAIDAGDRGTITMPNEADFENQPRPYGPFFDIGADEYWQGLVLSSALPGRAGQNNRVRVSGGDPADLIFLFTGTSTGSTPLGFPGCPTLSIDVTAPLLLGIQPTDDTGAAEFISFSSPLLAGTAVPLQAVGIRQFRSPTTCQVSNLVEYHFPPSN